MRLRLKSAASGAVAAAATVLFAMSAAGTAHADSTVSSVNPTGSATATFQSYGEHFYLHDDKADGRGAFLSVYRFDTGQTYYYYNHKGAGTSVDIDLSMAEGTIVRYYVCTSSGTEVFWNTCGDTWSDSA